MIQDYQSEIRQIANDKLSGAVELANQAANLIMQFADFWEGDETTFTCELVELCRQLMAAQPAMASIVNLCNDVMYATEGEGIIYLHGKPQRATLPQAVSNAALKFSAFLAHHNRRIANEMLPFIHSGALLLTHSSSSTVLAALLRAKDAGKRFGVVCTESRPQCEGVTMARQLAEAGIEVEVIADATAAVFIHGFYTLLIGADAITSEGVVNKVGTLGMALAAKQLGLPVYCLAGTEKFLPQGATFEIEEKDPTEIALTEPLMRGFNVYFDQTPLELITRFFTEDGTLTAEDVRGRLGERVLHGELKREM
jgi:translation initiation factor 2B subunit (eIF-2B alpha/beta/delta family)